MQGGRKRERRNYVKRGVVSRMLFCCRNLHCERVSVSC